MAIDVSALGNYVEEKRLPLIAKSFLTGKTIDLVQLETGVKQDTALNLLTAEVEFGDGASCGWDPTDGVALSQRLLKPVFLKINQAFCDKNLLKKWASYEVNLAAGRETLPFAERFMDEIAKGIQAKIEYLIWNGDSLNPNEPDGYLKLLLGGGATSITVTGMTNYNAIKAVYNAIPTEIIDKEDTVIFVSEQRYRGFIQELVAANLFHFAPDYKDGEYKLPGTSIRVIAVNGLNNKNQIVAGRLSNFFYGVGAEDDKDTFDFWYSKDNREFRLAVYFAIAAQVAFPDEVIVGEE
jgi:hypothetical protein